MGDVVVSLRDAIRSGDLETVRTLLDQHPDIIHHQYAGESWLHMAATFQHIDVAKLLIALGIDVNAPDDSGNRLTPLNLTVFKDNCELARLLLEHGADPNHGREVISAVVGTKVNCLAMIRLLEEYGADIHRVFTNEMTGQPMNVLGEAIAWGKTDVVEYLRSRGAVLPGEAPPQAKPATLADEVVKYFTEQFGPVRSHAIVEIVPTEPRIMVHVVPAAPDRNHVTLFTTGMSDRAMTVPGEFSWSKDYRFGELFIQMPGDWPYEQIHDPRYNWPVRWLRWLGAYPHQNGTWLGGPVGIADENDPPCPVAPGVGFTSMLYMAEMRFQRTDGETVQLYRLTPLYLEERELERAKGLDVLLRALDAVDTPMIVDLNRPPACAISQDLGG